MLSLILLPEWNCNTCSSGNKQLRGCEQDAPVPLLLDGEEIVRCPRRPLFEEPEAWTEYLQEFHDYQEGRFPELGGTQDQAYGYLQVMRTMASAKSEAEGIRMKQEEMKRNTV